VQQQDKQIVQAAGCLIVSVLGLFVFIVTVIAAAFKWVIS
jgi:hypothetical protein